MHDLDPVKLLMLNRFLHLIEACDQPGEIDPVLIELIKLSKDPEAHMDVQQLSTFAKACRTCKKIWLFMIGFVLATATLILWGKNVLLWLRDTLNHIPLDQQ